MNFIENREELTQIRSKFAILNYATREPVNFSQFKGKYVVYAILNLVNKKYYIGSTIDFAQRVNHYIYHYFNGGNENREIVAEIARRGIENFVMIPIDTANTRDELRIKEGEYILSWDATNPAKGYNKMVPKHHTIHTTCALNKASRSKHVVAINPDTKHIVISEGMKLFADYTDSTKDLVKNEARTGRKHRGYFIIYLNYKDRTEIYERMYTRAMDVQNDVYHTKTKRSRWRDGSVQYIECADLVSDMLEDGNEDCFVNAGYHCDYLHYDMSGQTNAKVDPISVFFDTVDLSQFDGIKDTNEET